MIGLILPNWALDLEAPALWQSMGHSQLTALMQVTLHAQVRNLKGPLHALLLPIVLKFDNFGHSWW